MKKPVKKITPLSWDSDFFGIRVGKLHHENEELDLASISDSDDFDLIYVYSDKPIKNNTINCYDKKVTFKKRVLSKKRNYTSTPVKRYIGKLTPALLDLAITSGVYSRFKLDPKLSSYFKSLYKQWIQNSLTGNLADFVYVYEKENKIIGFVTLKKKDSYYQIGLIATSNKYRGIGVGSSLLQKVEEIVDLEGGEEIRVISQLDNIPACKFYKKNNYEINSIEHIYHFWV